MLTPKTLTPAEMAKGDWTIPSRLTTPSIPEQVGRISTIHSTRFYYAQRYPQPLDQSWIDFYQHYTQIHKRPPSQWNETYITYQCERANLGRPCVGVDLLIYEEDIPATGFCQIHVRIKGYDLEFTPEQITTLVVKAAALEASYNARFSIKENLAPTDATPDSTPSTSTGRRRRPLPWREPANMDPDARRRLLSDKRITQEHLIDYFGRR